MHRVLRSALAAFGLAAAALSASAQTDWPNRPIKWVVPFAPGGPTDAISRVLSARLAESLGQGVVIENRSGASGAIGSEFVARAAPDGYTVVFGTQSTHASNLVFFPNMAFDPIRDFQPLTLVGTSCLALIVPPNVAATTARELVEWIGRQGGAASYGTAAAGSSQHVAAELMLRSSNVRATHVPYRGSGAAMPDLLGGRLTFMFDNLPSSLPLARSGKVKALAQTCAKRSPSAPDLPTMVEAGFKDFVIEGWYGVFAPARTPRAIAERLSAEINKALRHPESMERWKTLGFDPIGSTPDQLSERQRGDLDYWRRMIEFTGVKVE
jgi:tripartite-type tricarboxylate transporter receptor subunit TctC